MSVCRCCTAKGRIPPFSGCKNAIIEKSDVRDNQPDDELEELSQELLPNSKKPISQDGGGRCKPDLEIQTTGNLGMIKRRSTVKYPKSPVERRPS